MPRVKRGKISVRKRERLLRLVKGYRWGRKSKERLAKEALLHAGKHSFRERKRRAREFRALWQIKINAAARQNGTSYARLMHALRKSDIALDRKMLAYFAEREPEIFAKIVEAAKEQSAR